MKFEIRERDRRALLVMAAAAVIYGVFSFGLLPAFDALKEGSSGISDKVQQLSKYRRALIRKGNYVPLLEQARKNVVEAEARFIRGDNPTLASVELQTIVEMAAQKAGLVLNQRNVSPARKKDDFFNEITMAIALEGTPSQVSSFLAEIRGAPKVVRIQSLQMAPAEVMQEAPSKGDFKKMLRANVTISAQLPVPLRKNG